MSHDCNTTSGGGGGGWSNLIKERCAHFVRVTWRVFSKLIQDMYSGDTPLITACRRGHVETARVLLKHGTNVDQQNYVSSRKL